MAPNSKATTEQTDEKPDRAVMTAASDKFFPSLLNLIGSIRKFHPALPIFVYDLGLSRIFRMEIASMPDVTVCEIPHETSFWRACYTWKASIFMNPKAKLCIYLDAGNQLLRPLDDIFATIDDKGYVVVEQQSPISDILPTDYVTKFNVPKAILDQNAITAGIFGFKVSHKPIQSVIQKLHEASLAGLCLGFSKLDSWKNKGVNKTEFVRDCKIFRHDTTLFSMFLRMDIPDLQVGKFELYGGSHSKDYPGQYLWNMRMNYDKLDHVAFAHSLANSKMATRINRMIIGLFFALKKTRLRLKRMFSLIPGDLYSKAFGRELAFMDSFHDYPAHSNVRYYHYKKAYVVNGFMRKNARRQARFLDAGAGTGPYSHIASDFYGNVYLFEYDASELARAEKNLAQFDHKNIAMKQVDLREIPLGDESVDVAVCSEVLEHVPGEEKAAAELYRIMKPGGKLLLSMPNNQSVFYKRAKSHLKDLLAKPIDSLPYPDWERVRHVSFSSHAIEKIAMTAGFTISKRIGVNILPLPTKLRETLESRLPWAFRLFVAFDRLLSHVIPRFGSFYFVELEKPFNKKS